MSLDSDSAQRRLIANLRGRYINGSESVIKGVDVQGFIEVVQAATPRQEVRDEDKEWKLLLWTYPLF